MTWIPKRSGSYVSSQNRKLERALSSSWAFHSRHAPFTLLRETPAERQTALTCFLKGSRLRPAASDCTGATILEAALRARGMEPANFESHLRLFDLGMPPHGGFAIGLERLTARILNLPNVRQAVLYPRDRYRVTP
jgi:aspartyl-tRNA synthetase